MCSYFIHFADTPAEEEAARARQIRYYKECVIAAFPGDPATAPPSYRYFIGMVERLRNVRPEDLTENSVLLGSPEQISDTLKKVEAALKDDKAPLDDTTRAHLEECQERIAKVLSASMQVSEP